MFVGGEIDLATAASLNEKICHAEALRPSRVVLDCRGLEFIDCSGISALVEAQERADREGRLLLLTRVPSQARRLLDLAGLNGTFTLI